MDTEHIWIDLTLQLAQGKFYLLLIIQQAQIPTNYLFQKTQQEHCNILIVVVI